MERQLIKVKNVSMPRPSSVASENQKDQAHKCFVNRKKATGTGGAALTSWLCIPTVTYLIVKKMDSVVVEF